MCRSSTCPKKSRIATISILLQPWKNTKPTTKNKSSCEKNFSGKNRAYNAEKAQEKRQKEFEEKVLRDWTPVIATIKSISPTGSIAYCKRIAFKPTKTRSTLGSVIDGPPEKVTIPLKNNPVFLKDFTKHTHGISTGESWELYIWPTERTENDPEGISVYQAVFPPNR